MTKNDDINPWDSTPDLGGFSGAFPKPAKKGKKPPKPLKAGNAALHWARGRETLKVLFRDQGISSCEIMLGGCKGKLFWSFAHILPQGELSPEQVVDPHFVVFACNHCHGLVDKMNKQEAYTLLKTIVENRGW